MGGVSWRFAQARTFPARDDPEGDGRGYIGWHRDHDGPGCEKRHLFLSAFPMFVPSLSWQNGRF